MIIYKKNHKIKNVLCLFHVYLNISCCILFWSTGINSTLFPPPFSKPVLQHVTYGGRSVRMGTNVILVILRV